ncbi:YhgE/Pip family protein [Streptococcus sp. 20-1249]|uniref:YhgE/Pip family protein n=1 Tax=Streptococcus hepaticus TaxID=3349163 RepID=UPI0037495FBB
MLEELKGLLKKPMSMITLIGVALIPTLYNVIFLSSMWDPYGNLEHLPVAVVNQDQSAKLEDKNIHIGQDMVDNMSKNKILDFHFVSENKAKKGLEKGDYYMVITFPKDLSEKATSLMTEKPEKLTIHYQTTKGLSFVSSKMSESAMAKLKEKVSESVTETYTSSVFKSMTKLQSGMTEAADGGQKLLDGTDKLQNGSQTLTSNLNTLSSSSQTFSTGATTLNKGIVTYTDGVASLSSGLNSLNSGVTAYTDGVNKLTNGAQAINSKSDTLLAGINQLKAGSSQIQQLVDGSHSLTAGLEEMANKTSLSNEQSTSLDQVKLALPQINASLQTINSQLNSGTNPDTQAIETALTTIAGQAQAILTSSQAEKTAMLTAVQATSAYQTMTSDQQAEITAAINNTPSTTASAAQNILENVKNMSGELQTLQTQATSLGQLKTALGQLSVASTQVLPGAVTSIQTLQNGLSGVNMALTQKVLPGSHQLSTGIVTLQGKLASGSDQLLTGTSQYTTGVAQLANGATTLSSKSNQLLDGTSKASAGANKLDSNSSQLASGARQLADGAEKIADGSSKLADGGQSLTDGLTTLNAGTDSLTSSLRAASEQLSLVSTTEENAKAVSKPVKLKHSDKDNVDNNGVGMAPYMMSVSMMVVALSANVLFAKALSGRHPENRWQWARNKLFINGTIATVGAIVLYLAVRWVGVNPNHEGLTLGMTILASWTLMALVTALVGWHNRFGSYASLILLLLQLGSSAGTYPIELSQKFFQTIQPYLPMAYSVAGLRESISLTGNVGSQAGHLAFFLIGFMALALLIYRDQEDL